MKIIHTVALPVFFAVITSLSGCKPNQAGQAKAESIATPNDRLAAILNIKSWDVTLPENFGENRRVSVEYYDATGTPTSSHFGGILCGKESKLCIDFHSLDNGKMLLQTLGAKHSCEQQTVFPESKPEWSSATPIIGNNEIILFREAYYRPEGKTDKLSGIKIVRVCSDASVNSTDLSKKTIEEIKRQFVPSVRP